MRKIMECPNGCPSSMKVKKIEKLFHRGKEPIVISDLKANSCPDCGQESIPLNSARIVEKSIPSLNAYRCFLTMKNLMTIYF